MIEARRRQGKHTLAGLFAVLAVAASVSTVAGCCQRLGSGVGGVAKKGSKVQAPWSRAQNMYAGTVSETYGKLALIDFADGDHGWAELTKLEPPGIPGPAPADPCAVRVGQKGRAPWSRSGTLYPGVVTEVHGKLAHVNFDDGDQGWALCASIVP